MTSTLMPPMVTMLSDAMGLKLVPLIVMVAPTGPERGEKEVIVGTNPKVNPERAPVPKLLVTVTSPVAPLPTTAVILVEELITNEAAGVPPKLTAVMSLKFPPSMVTVVPFMPVVGVNDVTAGCAVTVLRRIAIPVLPEVAITSGFPSRSISAMANVLG